MYPTKKVGKFEKFDDDYENSNEDETNKSDRGSIFDSDVENNGDDDDENNRSQPGFAYNIPQFRPAGLFQNYMQFNPNYNQPLRYICRQCPQQKALNVNNMNAPDFTCTPYQNHLLCQCCLEPFPDRTNEIALQRALSKQSCSMCFKSFCNLYWGCRKNGCLKCLSRFIDLEVDTDCWDGLINENQFESRLFSDWMVRKNKTVKEVFGECVQKLMTGAYKAGNLEQNKVLDHIVCRGCGLSLFRELAYQYRLDLPKEELLGKNFLLFINNRIKF